MLISGQRAGLMAASAAIATALIVTVVSGCGSPGGDEQPAAGQQSVVTSTTRIASAGVLGNDRRPDESCAPEPTPVDPGPPDRAVRHAAGETEVRADPQRIVVLSGDQLDALCALGLQSRVVAAALPDGTQDHPGTQPCVPRHSHPRRAGCGHPQLHPTSTGSRPPRPI